MVNAKIVMATATVAIAIATVFMIFFIGDTSVVDADGNGILDTFTMKGELTCAGCAWSDDTGTESDIVRVEISVDTTTPDKVKMEIHAIWSIVHFYMVDGTWYTIMDPQTTAPNDDGVEEMIFETPTDTFEFEDVVIDSNSAPVQVSCTENGWDQDLMDSTFKIRDDAIDNFNYANNKLIVETLFGDVEITFANGEPELITGKYLPQLVKEGEDPAEVSPGDASYGYKDVTFKVTSFDTGFKTISDSIKNTFDDTDCEAAVVDPTAQPLRRLQEEEVKLTQEQIIAATQEINNYDTADLAYRAQFGSPHDEGFAQALQMDRNLAVQTDTEDLSQVAFSSYRVVGGIPAGLCEIENDGERKSFHRASGYTLVARGGYIDGKGPGGFTDDLNSSMHSTICKSGNRCVFTWRGSSNLPNWINNIEGAFFTLDINTDVAGQERKVHKGFLEEAMLGINAKNSYDEFPALGGTTTADKTLGEIWNDIEAIAGCTERIYTGHSLGGAAANVGQYLFEKSTSFNDAENEKHKHTFPGLSNHRSASGVAGAGAGRAHSFAAPQAWITDRAEKSSAFQSCDNKRFFLSTNKRVDPVPGLLKIAKVTGKDYDFSDTPFEIYHNDNYCKTTQTCTKRTGWRRRWFGTWKCKKIKDCGPQTKIIKKPCDDESGGAPLWKAAWKWGFGLHVNPYITYLEKASDGNVGGSKALLGF